jgi:hypothetical protein
VILRKTCAHKINMKDEVDIMQIQLNPAHPDFGKVGFAELVDRIRTRAYQLYADTHTATLLTTGSKPRLRCWV